MSGPATNVTASQFLAAADQAMQAGRLDEAVRLWNQLLVVAPGHPDALLHLGQHALFRRDLARAQSLLEASERAAPGQVLAPLNLAYVHRAAGNPQAELSALTRALVIDPYFYPALLAKAALLERMGQARRAAQVYRDVLSILPPEDQLPPSVRKQVGHGRAVVAENQAAFATFVADRLAGAMERHADQRLRRFAECRDIALGRAEVQVSQPHMLTFPQLPAIGFFDRDDFPWLDRLEAASDVVRDELTALLAEDSPGIRPYLAHPDGAPLNQWAELNRSPRWSAYFLWEGGTRHDAHCAKCPQTAALVESLPLCHQAGFGPTVNFSILKPRTRLPPHTGDVNTRLIVHLPLIIPAGCTFRVGNETRPWRYGEAWVFDDTIDHEARNDSDEIRAILMLDVWHPALSECERDLVTILLNAMREYYR